MSALSEAYAGIKALFDADSGGTGLNNSSSPAFVKSIQRLPEERAGSPPPTPYLGVTLSSAARLRSQGSTGNIIRVDMTVVSEADRDQTYREDTIVDRIKTVFSGVTPSGTAWTFTQLEPISESPDAPRDARVHRPFTVSYEMAAFEGATPGLVGAQASLSGYTGGKCFSITRTTKRRVHDATPYNENQGYLKHELSDMTEGGTMRFYVTGAPPTDGLKTGVTISLKSGVDLAGDIHIFNTNLVATVGSAQIYDAQFVVHGVLA